MTADLIARLEAATYGSFELDREIAVAAGVADALSGDGAVRRGDSIFVPKPYSVSLDAALTLVPEGRAWWVSWSIANQAEAVVHGHDSHCSADAATSALALCAAALKAQGAS